MAVEVTAGEKVATAAIGEAGTGLKTAWRRRITGDGLGPRLARAIRSEPFPKGKPSLDAATFVQSKAPVIVDATTLVH
ncbi:MAG: DUF6441 family protein [Hyphomicrobiales bacterium]